MTNLYTWHVAKASPSDMPKLLTHLLVRQPCASRKSRAAFARPDRLKSTTQPTSRPTNLSTDRMMTSKGRAAMRCSQVHGFQRFTARKAANFD